MESTKEVQFCEIDDCKRNKARECLLAKKQIVSPSVCSHRLFMIHNSKKYMQGSGGKAG
ncbi:MAG: hypothetical protein HQK96_07700 [Nitrospirae bacterium]|nr:hypothetical protein [Nitrospirota bacterium]